MNVSAVGSGFQVGGAAGKDPEIERINGQIKELQRRIGETRKNESLDQETRNKLVQEYQKQIEQLQTEKLRHQTNKQIEHKGPEEGELLALREEGEQDDPDVHKIDAKTQEAFIALGAAQGVSGAVSSAKTEQQHKLRVASATSYGRDRDPAGAREAAAKLGALNKREIAAWKKASDAIAESAQEDGGPAPAAERPGEAEEPGEVRRSGHGRMEPGQFYEEEA